MPLPDTARSGGARPRRPDAAAPARGEMRAQTGDAPGPAGAAAGRVGAGGGSPPGGGAGCRNAGEAASRRVPGRRR
jgi:hypothetical protein